MKVRLVALVKPQVQAVVPGLPHVQVLAPRFTVRVPDPLFEKLFTLTVAVSPALPNVPVKADVVRVPIVHATFRVIVPPPDDASNVPLSAVELGHPPAAKQVLPAPPVEIDQ